MSISEELEQKVGEQLANPNNPNFTDINVASLAATLMQAGIPASEVATSMLGIVISLVRRDDKADLEYWTSALDAARVIVARDLWARRAN